MPVQAHHTARWLFLPVVLALLCPVRVAHASGDKQVVDCRFATLQADLQAGGRWFYAPRQCRDPIVFTSSVTVSRSAMVTSQGRDIILSGDHRRRLFQVTGGGLTLTGLTIERGHTPDGAGGGAILVGRRAMLTLNNCMLRDNSTGDGSHGSGGGDGGAILTTGGMVTISGSMVHGNRTGFGSAGSAGGDGGAIASVDGTVTIAQSVVSDNGTGDGGRFGGSGGVGGAVFAQGGLVTIRMSTLQDNVTGSGADGCDAGPDCPRLTSGGSGGSGGALASLGATITIDASALQNNAAGSGAYAPGSASLGETGNGGAVSFATDAHGSGGTLLIANSTLSDNRAVASSSCCGPDRGGAGGAISVSAFAPGSTVTIVNCTLSGNRTSGAGGALAIGSPRLVLANTLAVGDSLPEVSGDYEDRGGNLVGLHGYTLAQILKIDSHGQALPANNGGPTQTVALTPGSPAIGAGLGAICRSSPVNGVDQRGVRRPAAGNCDSGSYQH